MSETPARPLSRRERKANAWQGRRCENCEIPLQGPFCHQCGQPEKTPIRDLVSLSTDAFDYLFDVDAKVWRTLVSLFFVPGKLTEAYLRGKRMSFVRPLRIYLVISALLFIVVTSMSDLGGIKVSQNGDVVVIDGDGGGDEDASPDAATTVPPDASDAEPRPASAESPPATPSDPASARPESPPAAEASTEAAAAEKKKEPISLTIVGSQPWHPTDNPLVFDWLPDAGNQLLNDYIGIIQANLELARDDPKRLGHAFLRVLPQSLFVLLPIFALLLKIVLVFKRRLYMEHLMVAIHSHTFVYIGILVAVGLSWMAEHWPEGWTNPWWLLMGLAIAWIPVNLFLTQKRVYRQRWWGAPFAFGVIGTCYLILISFTAFGALVMSLVNM